MICDFPIFQVVVCEYSVSQFSTVQAAAVKAWREIRSGDVPAVVPVPTAVWLLGRGLIGLLGLARRKR